MENLDGPLAVSIAHLTWSFEFACFRLRQAVGTTTGMEGGGLPPPKLKLDLNNAGGFWLFFRMLFRFSPGERKRDFQLDLLAACWILFLPQLLQSTLIPVGIHPNLHLLLVRFLGVAGTH